ncbi:MAG: M23 family metallopeptidase [Alphaproteobacteria bacterium]|nr:M23 family metallopeptidase [Alphaproteobacteria bacterium]
MSFLKSKKKHIILIIFAMLTFIFAISFFAYYQKIIGKFDILENEPYRDMTDDSRVINNQIDPIYNDNLNSSTYLKQYNSQILQKPIMNDNYDFVDGSLFAKGDTLISKLSKFGIGSEQAILIAEAINPVIPVNLIQINDKIEIYKSSDNGSLKLALITKYSRVDVKEINGEYHIDLSSTLKTNEDYIYREFFIKEDFYTSAFKADVPEYIIQLIIELQSKNINFSRDIIEGTLSKIYYSKNIDLDVNESDKYTLHYTSINIDEIDYEFFNYVHGGIENKYYDTNGVGVGSIRTVKPLTNLNITSQYGMRLHPVTRDEKMHYGIDYAADLNEPVRAIADGVIDFIGDKGDFGKYLRISHSNNIQSVYAHLNKFSESIIKGSFVNQSDIIGYAGKTGLSTDVHLHFEIIVDQKRIDPNELNQEKNNYFLEGEELKKFNLYKNNLFKMMMESKRVTYQ